MLRRIAAVLLGFLSAFLLVGLVQMISARMYPPPEDLITQDKEAMEAYFTGLPSKARYIILLAHVIGCFAGAFIAARIADAYRFYLGLLVGVVMLVASASYNMASFCPQGIFLLDMLLCIGALYLGARLGSSSLRKV